MRNNRSNTDPVIDVRSLTKRFGNFTAVDEISFTVKRGAIFGFLGPNGSGKTTTIRMLLGLLSPSEGTAFVLGNDIRKRALSIRARLGYMSQKFTLYNDLSVVENLRFYGRGYGLSNGDLKRRMAYVLEMADLKGREQEKPPRLSGGWRQRLALGAAIMHDPDIIFLDEPTAGVDPLSRRAFWDLLYQISAAGKTIFVTTHYMDEAEHCEELAFIYQGHVIANGSPQQIKNEHLNGDIVQLSPERAQSTLQTLNQAHNAGLLGESVSVSLHGAQIHVVTRDVAETRKRLEAVLAQTEEAYSDMDLAPPSLEDAFIRLVDLQTVDATRSS